MYIFKVNHNCDKLAGERLNTVARLLFDRACKVNLLYSQMIAQSETPAEDIGVKNNKCDEATFATIKYCYELAMAGGWLPYVDGTAKDRRQFRDFCERVLIKPLYDFYELN